MKLKFCLPALAMMLSVAAINANAASGYNDIKETVAVMTREQKEIRITEMKQRVQEIKEMDKSQLNKEERKGLRVELRNMNKEAKAMGHSGIYISIGGLIIIILLLILIL